MCIYKGQPSIRMVVKTEFITSAHLLLNNYDFCGYLIILFLWSCSINKHITLYNGNRLNTNLLYIAQNFTLLV